MLTPVIPSNAPRPLGHYVAAIIYAGQVYVSGTLPVAPDGSITPVSPFEDQMRQLLENCDSILESSASHRHKVIMFTLYLTHIDHWETADRLSADFFGLHRPAREVINVPGIRKGFAVQATMIAAI